MKKLMKASVPMFICIAFLIVPISTREITATAVSEALPGGATIGLRLYLEGLLVVGMSDIPSYGIKYSPGKKAGIYKGDRITHMNGTEIKNATDFGNKIQDNKNKPIKLTVLRDGEKSEKTVVPIYYETTGEYKLGIWVRDSAAGIGTVSFILPDGTFAALGHCISDIDTNKILVLRKGEVSGSYICSVLKGERGSPGELCGYFDNSSDGYIARNTEAGIFGKLSETTINTKPMKIESAENITTGPALIHSNISGYDIDEYSVDIIKVNSNDKDKTMIIKVTDKRLLEATGGIVQGMSGSPVIRDNKIIGAVTHVFLNDPTMGYAISAEKMIEEINKIR